MAPTISLVILLTLTPGDSATGRLFSTDGGASAPPVITAPYVPRQLADPDACTDVLAALLESGVELETMRCLVVDRRTLDGE